MSKLFGPADFRSIEEAIARAEQKTAGEIVALVVPASSEYFGLTVAGAVVGWLLATGAVATWEFRSAGVCPLWGLAGLQLVGVWLGAWASRLDGIRARLLGSESVRRAVHEKCMASFIAQGLTETRDRTGILIYVSELEKTVEILADKGIYAKTPVGYWNDQVQHVVRGIHANRATPALCEAIEQMGTKLAEHFPPSADDRNELSNHVRR
ncbi:MAG: TPM domain-containing protein [Bacteriovoracia bacterium]